MSASEAETELVFYAKLDSLDGLDQAEIIEKHVQFEAMLTTGHRCRVRQTIPIRGGPVEAEPSYVFTLKSPNPEEQTVKSTIETNISVDRNFYERFALTATRGMCKTRYRFTGKVPVVSGGDGDIALPPVTYEVDTFFNKEGEVVPYIKIDVELDAIADVLKGHNLTMDDVKQKFTFGSLPIQMSGVFLGDFATPEQNRLLDHLWQNEFTQPVSKEIYVKQEAAEPAIDDEALAQETGTEETQENADGSSTDETQGTEEQRPNSTEESSSEEQPEGGNPPTGEDNE